MLRIYLSLEHLNKIFGTTFTDTEREGFAGELKASYQTSVRMCDAASDKMEARYYTIRDRENAAGRRAPDFKNFADSYKKWCLQV